MCVCNKMSKIFKQNGGTWEKGTHESSTTFLAFSQQIRTFSKRKKKKKKLLIDENRT